MRHLFTTDFLNKEMASLEKEVADLYWEISSSEEEFCIDMDGEAPDGSPLWKWMDYSTKGSATRSLSKLVEGLDFLTSRLESSGGRPAVRILFSRDGLKRWGMAAGTDRGRQIQDYFLECERRAAQVKAPRSKPLELQESVFGFLEGQQASQELIDAGYKVKMFTLILQGLGKTKEQALSVALRSVAKTNSIFADVVETAGGSFALAPELPEVTFGAAQVAELLPDNWDEDFCRKVCECLKRQYLGSKGRQRGYLVNILAEKLGWIEKTYGPKSKKPTWQLTTEGQKHGIMKLALIPNSNRTSEKMNVHYFKSAVELIIAKGNQVYRDWINLCEVF